VTNVQPGMETDRIGEADKELSLIEPDKGTEDRAREPSVELDPVTNVQPGMETDRIAETDKELSIILDLVQEELSIIEPEKGTVDRAREPNVELNQVTNVQPGRETDRIAEADKELAKAQDKDQTTGMRASLPSTTIPVLNFLYNYPLNLGTVKAVFRMHNNILIWL
jgi:hypothetical protein